MSFVTQNISLKGNQKQPVHKLRLCSKCEKTKPPEGGIEMSPTRWICAVCWTHKAIGRAQK